MVCEALSDDFWPHVEDTVLKRRLTRAYEHIEERHAQILEERGITGPTFILSGNHDILMVTGSERVTLAVFRAPEEEDTILLLMDQGHLPATPLARLVEQGVVHRACSPDAVGGSFEISLLDAPPAVRDAAFDQVAEEIVEQCERRGRLAEEIGLNEALRLVSLAEAHMQEPHGEEADNCVRAHCGDALRALIEGMSGRHTPGDALDHLRADGMVTPSTQRLLEAVLDKLGAREPPPSGMMPGSGEESRLAIHLTTGILRYLIETAALPHWPGLVPSGLSTRRYRAASTEPCG